MRLSVRHISTYRYDSPVDRIAMRVKLFPSAFDGQKRLSWRVTANGEEVAPLFISGFGDEEGIWVRHKPPEMIEIIAEGTVITEDRAGVVRGLPTIPPSGVFLRTTSLTEPSEEIRELAVGVAGADKLEEMHLLMQKVKRAIMYSAGATTADTTAAQSLNLGAGVCQDYAHVFIAAARSLDRPARYIAGYVFPEEGGITAAHETHAWAEAHIPGLGWIGFDPSRGICPTERYVRLGCGLDAAMAGPLRGNVSGVATESLSAEVTVTLGQQ